MGEQKAVFAQSWEWLPRKLFLRDSSTGETPHGCLVRMCVPGGWLVQWGSISKEKGDANITCNFGNSVTFYPDPDHKWNGRSLAKKAGKA